MTIRRRRRRRRGSESFISRVLPFRARARNSPQADRIRNGRSEPAQKWQPPALRTWTAHFSASGMPRLHILLCALLATGSAQYAQPYVAPQPQYAPVQSYVQAVQYPAPPPVQYAPQYAQPVQYAQPQPLVPAYVAPGGAPLPAVGDGGSLVGASVSVGTGQGRLTGYLLTPIPAPPEFMNAAADIPPMQEGQFTRMGGSDDHPLYVIQNPDTTGHASVLPPGYSNQPNEPGQRPNGFFMPGDHAPIADGRPFTLMIVNGMRTAGPAYNAMPVAPVVTTRTEVVGLSAPVPVPQQRRN